MKRETLAELVAPSVGGLFAEEGLKAIIMAMAKGAKTVSEYLAEAGFRGGYGSVFSTNVSGDDVQKLDEFANELFIKCISETRVVRVIISEETTHPINIDTAQSNPSYLVAIDPLDGSSNIDANVSVGTIFSVTKWSDQMGILRPGRDIVIAGYIAYGPSTILSIAGDGRIEAFVLDARREEFIRANPIRQHATAKIYSVNESSSNEWEISVQRWIDSLKSGEHGTYTARYVGSLIADFHRGLVKGGIFAYPSSNTRPSGKLRLIYECAPLAFVAKQLGGAATDGRQHILDIMPEHLHQRSPLFIGSKSEVELAMRFF